MCDICILFIKVLVCYHLLEKEQKHLRKVKIAHIGSRPVVVSFWRPRCNTSHLLDDILHSLLQLFDLEALQKLSKLRSEFATKKK